MEKVGGSRKNQLIATLRFLLKPDEHIGLDEFMLLALETVQCEVAPRPVKIGARHVHRGGGARANRGMHGGGAGIAEQIEKTLVLRQLAQHSACEAVVEEQAGIEIVGKVDQQLEAVFLYFMKLAALRQTFVLRTALLALPNFKEYLLHGNTEHSRYGAQRLFQPLTRLVGSILFGAAYSCTCAQRAAPWYRSMASAYSGMSASYNR